MVKNSRVQDRSFHKVLAEYLDDKFTIPGTNIRFGIDPVIGLIPGLGDWLGAMISVYFMIIAGVKGAGYAVVGRMFFNILLDVTIGTIPLLGEVFDVAWKANQRNAKLLEDLEEHPEQTTKGSKVVLWTLLAGMIAVLIGTLFGIIWLIGKLMALIF